MPKYVDNKLHEFAHEPHKKPQHAPHPATEIRYGRVDQETRPPDETPVLPPKGKKHIQQVVGSFLYYGRAVNTTILNALSTLVRQQTSPTQTTATNTNHLLDYLHTHPDAAIHYYASDMILQIHSDASYINEPGARSTAGGHYFLGKTPLPHQPIFLNGAIYSLCTILKKQTLTRNGKI